MRILLASHAYPPRRTAGVEIYTQSLVRALARSHEVRVVYPVADEDRADHSIHRVSLDDGVVAHELTQHGRYRTFEETYRGARTASALAAVVDEFEPEVVHVQHIEGLGVDWLAPCAARGIRVVMTVHDHVLSCANGGQRFHRSRGACPLTDAERCADCTAHMNRVGLAARRWSRRIRSTTHDDGGGAIGATQIGQGVALGRSLLARLDRHGERRIHDRWETMQRLAGTVSRFVVPSRSLHADLLTFGLPASQLLHLPHGLEIDRYRRRVPPAVARRFGFLGSLVPHKGIDLLIEAFRGLPAEAELVVVGSLRADRGYVERLRRSGLPANVSLMGEVEHARIPALLEQIDCLVVPSIWEENAPLVVLEAFASGVPVIASRIGGLPELLAAGGGATYEPGSVDALRDLLRRAHAEPDVTGAWVRSIPRVPALDEHVAQLVRIYSGDRID